MGLCGGAPDDGSGQMRQQEAERQARIREGTNAISRIFGGKVKEDYTTQEPFQQQNFLFGQGEHGTPLPSGTKTAYRPVTQTRTTDVPGQFGPEYFSGLEKNYLDYYMPQFNRQAMDADRSTRLNLAHSGNLTGSVGATKLGRLAEDTASQRRGIIDQSIKYGSDQRKQLEDTRGNLVGQLESGAGVENVAGQAAAQANYMTRPPAFSPLGDLFKNYTAAIANAGIATGNPNFPGAQQYQRNLLFNIPSAGGSGGSSSMVA